MVDPCSRRLMPVGHAHGGPVGFDCNADQSNHRRRLCTAPRLPLQCRCLHGGLGLARRGVADFSSLVAWQMLEVNLFLCASRFPILGRCTPAPVARSGSLLGGRRQTAFLALLSDGLRLLSSCCLSLFLRATPHLSEVARGSACVSLWSLFLSRGLDSVFGGGRCVFLDAPGSRALNLGR